MRNNRIFLGVVILALVSILTWVSYLALFTPASAVADAARANLTAHDKPIPQPATLFASFAQPFADYAERQRSQDDKTDPLRSQRINSDLNLHRLNFVIYVFGDTYEPSPTTSVVTQTGSYTIVSLDTQSGQYNKVTISRDFDSPEVALRKTGAVSTINPSTRIGEAFQVGGFAFSRTVIENATGLSADFQLNLPDTLIARLVDTLGGVDIEIPQDIALYEFYVGGKAYAARDFPVGRWHLDGLTALGYAKAMPKGEYTMDTERVLRSQVVMEAALAKLRQELTSIDAVSLAPKLFNLATEKENLAGLETDFDAPALVVAGVDHLKENFFPALFKHGSNLGLPSAGKGVYVSAEYQGGGGGVRIPPGDMLIPIDGDPSGDLLSGYWKSVREFIRGELTQ